MNYFVCLFSLPEAETGFKGHDLYKKEFCDLKWFLCTGADLFTCHFAVDLSFASENEFFGQYGYSFTTIRSKANKG